MPQLYKDQVCWFDETHKKTVIGCESDYQTLFHRDKHGKLDPNGKTKEPRPVMKVKFSDEVRLMLGVTSRNNE